MEKLERFVEGLPIPARMVALLESGLWPRSEQEWLRQNLHPLIPKDRVHLMAPEETAIYRYRPPFATVAKLRASGQEKFWSTFAAPEGISADLSVVIADFGVGADSPILLDYRENRSSPRVIRLKWQKAQGRPNVWLPCADSFDQFADMLGLDRKSP
jgi:hypothetical protein